MPPKIPERRILRAIRLAFVASIAATALAACGGSNDSTSDTGGDPACPETGAYACQTGASETLYTFQWALNYGKSWFASNADAGAYGGGLDLNVEPVHRQGIKGQGINVLVVDSGVDLTHEDLRDNANLGMSWNFETDAPDPHPLLTSPSDFAAHGTNVAGIIGAAQNGKGVMGISPRVTIGGAAIVTDNQDIWTTANFSAIFGGAPWSENVDIINGSYGADGGATRYNLADSIELPGIRGLKKMRDGKGIVFIKAAGNAFDNECPTSIRGAYDCTNPANDNTTLEPNVIVAAALNAKGQASSYSSGGSIVWITGLGGEYGSEGIYGERSGLSPAAIAQGATGDGPMIFSTDISGCAAGFSIRPNPNPDAAGTFSAGESALIPGVPDNPNCDYSHMNGTSSAAPTIAGITALMLSANPELSWRDVRDILRQSARQVDPSYASRVRNDLKTKRNYPYNALFDLTSNSFINTVGDAQDIVPGATQIPVELGWVKNRADLSYSNWYGWGVPDAAKAVELALSYKNNPEQSRSGTQVIPAFRTVTQTTYTQYPYEQVSLLATFTGLDQTVDQFQIRLSGDNICLGAVGIAVESPAGTKSLLKMPLDHFINDDITEFNQFGLGSYAFYGENAAGDWKIYSLASNPALHDNFDNCESYDPGAPELMIEARVIAQ